MDNFQTNDDLMAQQAQLERRKKLLEAMSQRNMSNKIVGPTNYALAQALAQMGEAYFIEKGAKKLDADTSEYQRNYSTTLGNEMEGYLNRSQGTPDEVTRYREQGSEEPVTLQGQAPDHKGAIIQAMTSRLPEMQQLGMAELTALGKNPETWGNPVTVTGPDGKPMLRQYGSRGNRRDDTGARPHEKPLVVNNKVVDGLNPTSVLADHEDEWGPAFERDGDWIQTNKRTRQERQVNSAPRTTVNNNLGQVPENAGEKKFMETLGGKRAEEFIQAGNDAKNAHAAVNAVNQMEALDKAGITSGPTSDLAVYMTGLAKAIGFPVDAGRLANDEMFRQQFAVQIGRYIADSSVGRTLTDADRKMLEQGQPLPSISPEGRAKVYAGIRQDAATKLIRYRELQRELGDAYPQHRGMIMVNPIDSSGDRPAVPDPITPTVPGTPTRAAPGQTGGVIPLDEYLRRQNGGR